MSLGFYNNFPAVVQFREKYVFNISSRQLQKRLVRLLVDVNCKETSFEEIAIPTIPQGIVIFEFGIAETEDFNFLDSEEGVRVAKFIGRTEVKSLDFFCSIRYYKNHQEKRQALKFDYYMLRLIFDEGSLGVQVFHERGPRYISPEDLVKFLIDSLNRLSNRKILTELAEL